MADVKIAGLGTATSISVLRSHHAPKAYEADCLQSLN
jgi:hypothetical protein